MNWNKLLQIEDRIFTERRLRFYGTGVAVAYALSLAWRLVNNQWIILSDGRPRCVDFGWMWLSGKLAVAGDPAQIFDFSAFSAAQLALFGQANCPFLNPFVYPPTYLFIIYPFGLMPYAVAFAVWILFTVILYELAVYAIIPRRAALIAAIAPFCVAVTADFGHNGFLTAALIGFSLAFMERRPLVSGIFLGLLTYKPHLGVLFPVALLASRNWRALASAAAVTVTLAVAAAIVFGAQGWPSFLDTLLHRQISLSPDGQVELFLHSVYFGLLHWAGTTALVSWSAQLSVAAVLALTVWAVWAKPIPYSLKAALLCIALVTVTPYVLFYDLCILSIAVAFLVKDGMSRGFHPGERTVMLICVAALFLATVPIGPVICAALLFLTARRIVAYRRLDRAAALATADNFEMKPLAGN